jgi:hypothetical protein
MKVALIAMILLGGLFYLLNMFILYYSETGCHNRWKESNYLSKYRNQSCYVEITPNNFVNEKFVSFPIKQ